MPTLYLDIETIGCDDPALTERIVSKITPPKTLKKAESIAKWEQEEKPAAIEEAISRTALDGTYGRICCIGWAFDDEPVNSFVGPEPLALQTFFGACETAAIVEHYDRPVKGHTIVGHNVTWDLRFIWQRAVINGIPRPKSIPWNAKPWELQDTMLMWNPDREKRISLDTLCSILGVKTPKNGMDGSMVGQAWRDGKHEEIGAYCRADVEATRECFRRMH